MFVRQLTLDMKSGNGKQYQSQRIIKYMCAGKDRLYRDSKNVYVIVNLKAVQLYPAVAAKHAKYSLNIRSWMKTDQRWAICPQISKFCRRNLDWSWTLELSTLVCSIGKKDNQPSRSLGGGGVWINDWAKMNTGSVMKCRKMKVGWRVIYIFAMNFVMYVVQAVLCTHDWSVVWLPLRLGRFSGIPSLPLMSRSYASAL